MLYSVIIPCYKSSHTIRQVVELTISVERHEFAALLIEECYRAGAKKVNVDWTSDAHSRLNLLHADKDVLSTVLPWEEAKMKQMTINTMMVTAE